MSLNNPFTIIAGTDRVLLAPLCSADTMASPMMTIDGSYTKYRLRLFIKLPDRPTAEQLPAPWGYDRSTVTFEPTHLLLYGPLPSLGTIRFNALNTKQGIGKIKKRNMFDWEACQETTIYPATTLECPTLNPEDWISIDATSCLYIRRSRGSVKIPGLPRLDSFMVPAPDSRQHIPVQLYLRIKVNHLPTKHAPHRVTIVRGSAFLQPVVGDTGLGKEPQIDPDNDLGTPGTSSPVDTSPTPGASPSPEDIQSLNKPDNSR